MSFIAPVSHFQRKFILQRRHLARNVHSFTSGHYMLNSQALSGIPKQVAEGNMFTVLGIETSCDDTGVAIVRSDGVILAQALASQHKIHEPFGGIKPGLARDAHENNLNTLIEQVLQNAQLSHTEIDAYAATVGPGLELCLRVGAREGRRLSSSYHKPFVGVHHLEAHCLLARPVLTTSKPTQSKLMEKVDGLKEIKVAKLNAEFPFIALLVSGGHCQILLVHGVGRYTILGSTLDDAVGEAFDKAARMLGLTSSTNGGPAIEKLAREGDPLSIPLPVPLKGRSDCDFSFSGLKNAFRLAVQKSLDELGLLQTQQEEQASSPLLSPQLSSQSLLHEGDGEFPSDMSNLRTTVGNLNHLQKMMEDDHVVLDQPSIFAESASSVGDDQLKVAGGGLERSEEEIARLREEGIRRTKLKRELQKFNQSSSLKKSLARAVNVEEAGAQLPHQKKADLAASFQRVAILHLTDKLSRALELCEREVRGGNGSRPQGETGSDSADTTSILHLESMPKALAVVGGVAANSVLREALQRLCSDREHPLELIAAPPSLCTDNGVMVAWAAIEKLQLGMSDSTEPPSPLPDKDGHIKDSRPVDVRPRWPLGPEYREV